MIAELPDWFDLGFMRGLTVGTAVALAVAVLAALVFIRKLAARLVVAALLVALAGGAVFYRVQLDNCADSCTCKLLGSTLESKGCQLPGQQAK